MSIKNEPVPRDLHNAAMARRDARIAELTAEVGRYKADAERGQWMLRNASWMRYEDFTAMYVELPMDIHLDSYALRQDAIDIARNALKEGDMDIHYEACQERMSMLNDTKVKTYALRIGDSYEEVVTHADYQALEEKCAAIEEGRDELSHIALCLTADLHEANEELASLKARVAELVEADRAYSEATNGSIADAIDAHLAKASEPVAFRYAFETGKWTAFLSKARAEFLVEQGAIVEPLYAAPPNAEPAQPVEAVDVRAAFEMWASERNYRLSPDQNNCGIIVSGRYGHKSVQIAWEAWQAALAHPRHTGDEAVSLDEVWSDIDALLARVEQGTLTRAEVVALVRRKIETSRQDRTAPTVEQAGEVVNGEAVAEITRGPDNEFKVSWLIEGGIDALIEGETLYILGMNCPEDGAVELYAQPRPVGVPDGWKLVPVRPTEAMLSAGLNARLLAASNMESLLQWRAMLAAAPVAGGG